MAQAERGAIEAHLAEGRRFPPPAGVRRGRTRHATRACTSEAERDPAAFWGRLARQEISWIREPDAGARRLEPAVLQVVRRRHAERRLQLPRPPRGGGRRRQARVQVDRRARRRAHLHLRRAAWPRSSAPRTRSRPSASAARRPRRDLPRHGAGAADRDAGLRAHRRAALRRLRRLLGLLAGRPHPGRASARWSITGRRRLAPRQRSCRSRTRSTRPWPSARPCEKVLVVRRTEQRRRLGRRARRAGGTTPSRRPTRRCPPEEMGAEDVALPALHLRHHGEAEGHRAHDRAATCSARVCTAQVGLRPHGPTTSTGARPTAAGSRATRTSSTARSPTTRPGSSTRARRSTRPGRATGRSSSASGVSIYYTAPTAIRALIKAGEEWVQNFDLSSLRLLGHGRRADQPRGLGLVPRARRRGPLPDRRHLVADGDGRDHDRAAARPDDDEARLGDAAAAGHRRRRSSTSRATRCRAAAAATSC